MTDNDVKSELVAPPTIKSGENLYAGNVTAEVRAALNDIVNPPKRRPFSTVQVVLVINAIAVLALVAGLLLLLPGRTAPVVSQSPAAIREIIRIETHSEASGPAEEPASESVSASSGSQYPASAASGAAWDTAQKAYAQGQYAQAMEMYRRLERSALANPAVDLSLAEIMRVRTAQCLLKLQQAEEATRLLQDLSRSRCPLVLAAANYQLAAVELAAGQFLQARMHACRAAGAAGFAQLSVLEQDADFMAANALTMKVLALNGMEASTPQPAPALLDVLTGLDQGQLESLLKESSALAGRSTLGPRAEGTKDAAGRYDVCSAGSSLEDVLACLMKQAGGNIRWQGVAPADRQGAVMLSCRGVSAIRVGELACGSLGLIATAVGDDLIVSDAASCTSLSQQKQMLADEALSAWRKSFLRFPGDARIAQGHYLVGLLSEAAGETAAAINEYQLTASRFTRDPVAPLALLRSARLRISLREFRDAREELNSLLDNYREFPGVDDAYLCLAEANLEVGLVEEARVIFSRVFMKEVSPAVKARACLGAGQCHFKVRNYEEATSWLGRFISLSKEAGSDQRFNALVLLGRSQVLLGKADDAAAALSLALKCQVKPEQLADTAIELACVNIARGQHLSALTAMKDLEKAQLTAAQRISLSVTMSAALRKMHLGDQAIAMLSRHLQTTEDKPTRATLSMELAQCLIESGQLPQAHRLMSQVLNDLPAEQSAPAACQLAEVCLKLGKAQQASSLCEEIIKSDDLDKELVGRAKDILAHSYLAQKEFEKAASVYAAMAPGAGEGQ